MKSDIEIARACKMRPIEDVAKDLGVDAADLDRYGKYIAKVPTTLMNPEKIKQSNLILVTAMSPTQSGIGKTTVCIGLSMALNRLGKKSVLALREPSLGPCFGMKGGACGGGYSQVLPMEKINLHFTGDFHAITAAHNMITALFDNYLYQHLEDGFALKEVYWQKRVLDVNDRSLRYIVTGLGAKTNGIPTESGFDITPASEIMAILCLSKDEDDLRRRIENILLGVTIEDKPFTVKDMGVAGAITVLLRDALQPNLVQTIEGTPAFIHGGPFANIAHGCNSIIATKMAMSLGDYVVTEAGFGADLGAEKFLDIKCREAELQPKLAILVCTTHGLKMHGGMCVGADESHGERELTCGLANLDRHIQNLQAMGQTVIVTLNEFNTDTEEEVELVRSHCEAMGVGFASNAAFMRGGEGCEELAQLAVDTIAEKPSGQIEYAYQLDDSIVEKVEKLAKGIYGAGRVKFKSAAIKQMKAIEAMGYGHFPVCIAKTQYSFSDDAKNYGVPRDFDFTVRDFVLNTGAQMIVAVAGKIMRMPGLPKHPQAERIDIVDGLIEGLD